VLLPLGPQSVAEGDVLELAALASDPEGGPLVFGATPLLPGASLAPDGRFRYEPPYTAAGCSGTSTLEVELFVTDDGGPAPPRRTTSAAVTVVRDGIASDDALTFSWTPTKGGGKRR
jgi:hypothetical protein